MINDPLDSAVNQLSSILERVTPDTTYTVFLIHRDPHKLDLWLNFFQRQYRDLQTLEFKAIQGRYVHQIRGTTTLFAVWDEQTAREVTDEVKTAIVWSMVTAMSHLGSIVEQHNIYIRTPID